MSSSDQGQACQAEASETRSISAANAACPWGPPCTDCKSTQSVVLHRGYNSEKQIRGEGGHPQGGPSGGRGDASGGKRPSWPSLSRFQACVLLPTDIREVLDGTKVWPSMLSAMPLPRAGRTVAVSAAGGVSGHGRASTGYVSVPGSKPAMGTDGYTTSTPGWVVALSACQHLISPASDKSEPLNRKWSN